LAVALLMFGLAVTIALSQRRLVSTIKTRVHEVKRWGGWVLILVGLWLMALGIWAGFFASLFPV
jgi:uncharacterized membrane protein YidH (DUF202 family)